MARQGFRRPAWMLVGAGGAVLVGGASLAAGPPAGETPVAIPTVDLPGRHQLLLKPKAADKLECATGASGRKICVRHVTPRQGIGGLPVTPGSAPWQAEIYSTTYKDFTAAELAVEPEWERRHRCGGSLIAPGWVLTAAHCITQEWVDKGYRVRIGADDLSTGDGATYRIERMVRHAAYDARTFVNDIALLRIVPDAATNAAKGLNARPIALYEARGNAPPIADGERVFATGWGKTRAGPEGRSSAVLIRVQVKVVPNARCATADGYAESVTPGVVCAAAPGVDTCTGDSGGPLVYYDASKLPPGALVLTTSGEPLLIGIVSWGKGCAEEGKPGVYTRVSNYIAWIRGAMAAPPTVNSLP